MDRVKPLRGAPTLFRLELCFCLQQSIRTPDVRSDCARAHRLDRDANSEDAPSRNLATLRCIFALGLAPRRKKSFFKPQRPVCTKGFTVGDRLKCQTAREHRPTKRKGRLVHDARSGTPRAMHAWEGRIVPLEPEASAHDTLIVLARHGETALNREHRFRGRADPALTDKGTQQAELLAEAIAMLKPSALYTGPRLRARQTAEAIARHTGLRPEIHPGLEDLDYGDWTGRTDDEVARTWPAEYALWRHAPEALELPGGESMRTAQARIWAAIEQLAERHRGSTLVAVTHDQSIRLALCRVLDAPMASLHRLRIDVAHHVGLEKHKERWMVAWTNTLRR